MSESVEMRFSWADYAAVRNQINRAITQLGKSTGEAVKFGAWAMAKTLGTSTRVAPKAHKLKEVTSPLREDGMRSFEVLRPYVKVRTPIIIDAPNPVIAKRRKVAQIRYRGLAKAAWMFNLKKLGRSGSAGGATEKALLRARENSAVTSNLRGDNPFVKLESRLRYAQEALKGGPRDVNTAMERAGKMMEKIIDAKIKKAGAK